MNIAKPYNDIRENGQYTPGKWVVVQNRNGDITWNTYHKITHTYADGSGYGINYHGYEQPVKWDGELQSMRIMGFDKVLRIASPKEIVVNLYYGMCGTISRNKGYSDWVVIDMWDGDNLIATIFTQYLNDTIRAHILDILEYQGEI